MFPFEQRGEISFQGANNPEQYQQDNELLPAINVNNPSPATTSKGRGRARGRKSWPAGAAPASVNELDGGMMKKMVHREIERQRRQDMSGLFSSLRSLLPPQYVKGKRSMSDHIAESVNYITDLQKNIKDLGVQRDKIKMLQDDKSGGGGRKHGCSTASTTCNPCNIAVYMSSAGLQVQIVTGLTDQTYTISSALKVLNDEGLNVVSCVSNRSNEGFFHNIQCQVNDTTRGIGIDIDIEQLQQRLYEAIG